MAENEAHNKFAQEGSAFSLKYGNLSIFWGGLGEQIGEPSPHVAETMESEHTASADSLDEFTTGNYGVTTTPQIEYWFVVDPEREGLAKQFANPWPVEAKLAGEPQKMRKPLPTAELKTKILDVNRQLEVLGEPELMLAEGNGARLYTGPVSARQPPRMVSVVAGVGA